MWLKKLVNWQQISYLITFMAIAFSITELQKNRYDRVTKEITNPDYKLQEQSKMTALSMRKLIPTFGFDNLVAGSIYLDFIQYFGDKPARKATGYSLVPQYFTAIVERDPQFTEAYFTLSTANSMYAGKAEQTVNLMNQILQSTPAAAKNSHLIWTLKAIDETIFLGDTQAAQYSYQKAAESALQENNYQTSNIVTFNQKKAQFLATQPDTTEGQITAWNSVLPHVVKENEKQAIRDRLTALKAKLD